MLSINKLLKNLNHLIFLMREVLEASLSNKLRPHELTRKVSTFKAEYDMCEHLFRELAKLKNINLQRLNLLYRKLKSAQFLLKQLEAEIWVLLWRI